VVTTERLAVTTEGVRPGLPPVGELLRWWRERRRLSQLSLAVEARISTRHLSFVETGRSAPSREMVLKLAEHLDVPLRQRNELLLAAGFAPLYAQRGLDAPELSAVRTAIRQILVGHEPYPAIVVDRDWNLVDANESLDLFLRDVAAELLAPPINVMRLALHPAGLAPRIINFGEWRAHVLARLRRRVTLIGDVGLAELYEELSAYPGDEPTHRSDAELAQQIAVPLRLREEGRDLALLNTIAVFGSPRDITVSELAIESFFPADEATTRYLLSRRTGGPENRYTAP
jgi:transcriptional regulator with XRE-family HTH domain